MKAIFALVLLLISLVSWGQDIKIPPLRSPVMDEAHLLHPAQRQKLETLIYSLYQQKGPQVTVLTIQDLQGFPIEEFSIRVAEKWQLGFKKQGNGLLILISQKDRKMRIEVGQGIEGEITDVETHRWIQNYMVPAFRQNDYYTGIGQVILQVAEKFDINLGQGRVVSRSRASHHRADSPLNLALPFMILILVVVHVIFNSKPFLRGVFSGAGMAGVSFFMAPVLGAGVLVVFIIGFLIGLMGISNLLFAIAANAGRGGRGGFGGGGFGGGGGGWSGGGGGFSGGGSSGSW